MNLYLARIQKQQDDLINNVIPNKVESIENILKTSFNEQTPSVLSKKLNNKIINENDTNNKELYKLHEIVQDEIYDALKNMNDIERWIRLHIPKIQDGHNFGVEVQEIILNQIISSKDSLQIAWDNLPEYSNQRANAIEKITSKTTNTSVNKRTITKKSLKEPQEEPIDNQKEENNNDIDESETSDMTIVKTVPLHDNIAHVVNLDVKYYFNLCNILSNIQNQYMVAYDLIIKNHNKIILPRGHDQNRHVLHMY